LMMMNLRMPPLAWGGFRLAWGDGLRFIEPAT